MKKLSLVGLALALSLGCAYADPTITKSLQGSQDPRGPVGLDTSNSAYFPGHINAFGQTTAAPSQFTSTAGNATTCGTNLSGALVSGSTDVAGVMNVNNLSGCAVKFGSVFNAAPICVVSSNATSASAVGVVTTTSLMILQSPTTSTQYSYICIGNQ